MLKSIVVFLIVFIVGYILWAVGRPTLSKNTPFKIAFSRRSYWKDQVSGLEAEIEVAEALLEAETLEMNELKVAYDNAKGEEKASIKSKIDSLEVLLNHYIDNLRKLELELRTARVELSNL